MLLASIYLVVAPITTDPEGSLIALGVVLAGLPFYWLFIGSDHAPKFILNAAGECSNYSMFKITFFLLTAYSRLWGSFLAMAVPRCC